MRLSRVTSMFHHRFPDISANTVVNDHTVGGIGEAKNDCAFWRRYSNAKWLGSKIVQRDDANNLKSRTITPAGPLINLLKKMFKKKCLDCLMWLIWRKRFRQRSVRISFFFLSFQRKGLEEKKNEQKSTKVEERRGSKQPGKWGDGAAEGTRWQKTTRRGRRQNAFLCSSRWKM